MDAVPTTPSLEYARACERSFVYRLRFPGAPALRPTACAVAIVIDVSGSMNEEATVVNDSGERTSHAWSLLDIAKHAAAVMISECKGSKVCVLAYSNTVDVVHDWVEVTDSTTPLIVSRVYALSPDKRTNFHGAFKRGLEMFQTEEIRNLVPHVVLLTDGAPSDEFEPMRGADGYAKTRADVAAALERDGASAQMPTVTCVGIGNALDLRLLNRVSDVFVHMPEPGSVGGLCVNLVAHILSSYTRGDTPVGECFLGLEAAGHVVCHGDFDGSKTSRIALPHPCFDDVRHFRVYVDDPASVFVVVGAERVDGVAAAAVYDPVPLARIACAALVVPRLVRFADPLPVDTAALSAHVLAHATIDPDLYETGTTELLPGLRNQAHTWGRHYASSLIQNMMLGHRTNFRDKVLAIADESQSKPLFSSIAQQAEDHFMTITPPEPSRLRHRATGGGAARPVVLPDEFMRGGGCWGGDATVVTPDGTKCVRDLQVGDLVRGRDGFTRVTYRVVSRGTFLHFADGLQITQWHPVVIDGACVFPCALRHVRAHRECHGALFNFCTEDGHMRVNDNLCVTLGHGLDDPVARHEVWGNRALFVA